MDEQHTGRVAMRWPPSLLAVVDAAARARGWTRTRLIVVAVCEYLAVAPAHLPPPPLPQPPRRAPTEPPLPPPEAARG